MAPLDHAAVPQTLALAWDDFEDALQRSAPNPLPFSFPIPTAQPNRTASGKPVTMTDQPET